VVGGAHDRRDGADARKTLCPASVDTFLELWRDGEVERIDAETLDDSVGIDFRGFYAA